MTNTLAVNISATLANGSLTLATALKSSSAVCLNTTGANFQHFPTLSSTDLTSYYTTATTMGSVDPAKKYWLYVENYDAAIDVYVYLPNTVDVLPYGTLAYAGGTTYPQDVMVLSSGIIYQSLAAANTGHTPASSPTWWQVVRENVVPFGRSILLCTQNAGFFLRSASGTPQCKVVCIQDEA